MIILDFYFTFICLVINFLSRVGFMASNFHNLFEAEAKFQEESAKVSITEFSLSIGIGNNV